jgi:hypothetical protein
MLSALRVYPQSDHFQNSLVAEDHPARSRQNASVATLKLCIDAQMCMLRRPAMLRSFAEAGKRR